MFAAIGIFFLLGYLLGSVNFAVLVAKKHGVDILKEGSGNPGATNVKRVLGKGPGNLVFALDVLKGFVGAGLPYLLLRMEETPQAAEIHFTICVAGFVGTLLGHCFSCFLKFKGGKGVATFFGTLLAAAWPVGLASGAAWLIVAFLFRISSLAGLVAVAIAPLIALLLGLPHAITLLTLFMALLVFIRHEPNIRRLLRGEEPRIDAAKPPVDEAG